jgi:hypothetical protein
MKQLTDYPTPITDALCIDPAIEQRDVPSRVWRRMADLERKLALCREALTYAAHSFVMKSYDSGLCIAAEVREVAADALAATDPAP